MLITLIKTNKVKPQLFTTFLIFCFGTVFSQTDNSLSISPNPFNYSATINFDIVRDDTVSLVVYNNRGQSVRTFFNATILPKGSYTIDIRGDSLAYGVYFIVFKNGTKKKVIRAVKIDTPISDNLEKKQEPKPYPNPATSFLNIPIEGIKTIIVEELNGKVLKNITTDLNQISLLDLNGGQYFITIVTEGNKRLTTKLIISR